MKVIYNNTHYVDDAFSIINQAIDYFKKNNINQWQDGYPNKQSIIDDINENNSYILIDNNRVIGTMYFHIGNDPTYNYIENGHWLTDDKYAVIHRIAIDSQYKGNNYAYELVKYAIERCKENNINSIRIDTHYDNKSMQRFLTKHGFIQCGTIYLENGEARLAFEKIL